MSELYPKGILQSVAGVALTRWWRGRGVKFCHLSLGRNLYCIFPEGTLSVYIDILKALKVRVAKKLFNYI